MWLDFTKGLAAPLGAVLAGSQGFIGEAWRWKQRLGGSMRQGGICAAACLYALDHNVERLAEDHANAKALARGMAQIPGITVEQPETNLVFFDTKGTGMTAAAFAGSCASMVCWCPRRTPIARAPASTWTSPPPRWRRHCRSCVRR